MLLEVKAAVNFLGKLLNGTGRVGRESVELFKNSLERHLQQYYAGHWFPESPLKGSGYRCIRINHMIDPILDRAASESGISNVLSYFPNELTMWVDPCDVSYRIGENGSVGRIYDAVHIPSKSDLTPFSQESVKATSFNMISSCKSQLRDLVSSKHGNYAFTPFAAFVTS
jgi:protein Tob/BTG